MNFLVCPLIPITYQLVIVSLVRSMIVSFVITMIVCRYSGFGFVEGVIHFTSWTSAWLIATTTDTFHRASIHGSILPGGGIRLFNNFRGGFTSGKVHAQA